MPEQECTCHIEDHGGWTSIDYDQSCPIHGEV